jgi:hypothetical protein
MATNIKLLRGTVAPNQPMAQPDYDQRFQEQFSNVLRLYFNQLDNFTTTLTSEYGGSGLRFPYGAFSSYATQTTTANTATLLTFSQTDFANGVSLVSGSKLTVAAAGLYNLQFSVQLSSLENAPTDTSIWLRQGNDGGASSDIVGSTGLVGLPQRKSAGVPSHDIKGWNYFISMAANDYVQIYWSVTSTSVTIPTYPASVSPTRPSTASVVATLSFVSALSA